MAATSTDISLGILQGKIKELHQERLSLRENLEQLHQEFLKKPNRDVNLKIEKLRDQIESIRINEINTKINFDPRLRVNQLDGEIPILLFPLRLQARFQDTPSGKSLLIRVYPDVASIQSHDRKLTEIELAAGNQLWAAPETKADEKNNTRIEVWRGMAKRFGVKRAAWIRQATNPSNVEKAEIATASTLIPAVWTLPERFIFRLYDPNNQLLIPEQIGSPIPDGLEIGFDPTKQNMGFSPEKPDANTTDFEYPPELKWQIDFSEAEKVGMGISIPPNELGNIRKIGRIVVLGVRFSTNAQKSSELLEKLFEDHQFSSGFSIIPQGTPTNVTDENEVPNEPDVDDVYRRISGDGAYKSADIVGKVKYEDECDGLRLAHALGIDPEILRFAENAGQKDGLESIAMKRTLWAGTFGYYLQQMLSPSFENPNPDDPNAGERLILAARFFFTHFVFARGPLPAIRVGNQPYGILPVMGSMLDQSENGKPAWNEPFVDNFTGLLHNKALIVSEAWLKAIQNLAHANDGKDVVERLTELLGLQPSSDEFRCERLIGMEYLKNYADFKNDNKTAIDELSALLANRFRDFKNTFPTLFGDFTPRIFDLTFFGAFWFEVINQAKGLNGEFVPPLTGDVIDNLPLSEKPIHEKYPNYIRQFSELTFAEVRKGLHRIGKEGKEEPITALLYMLMRHSYLYDYAYLSMRLHHHLNSMPWDQFKEKEFYNLFFLFDNTYWDWLEKEVNWPAFGLVGALINPTALQVIENRENYKDKLGAFWSQIFGDMDELHRSLKILESRGTATLERLFCEQLDLAGYRLDAWLTGIVYQRLIAFRVWRENSRGDRIHPLHPATPSEFSLHISEIPRDIPASLLRYDLNYRPIENYSKGIYLGAFGWLENIESDASKVVVDELPDDLQPKNNGQVTKDQDNYGFVHAPSLNHAVTAAVLRSASVTHPDQIAYNINLSSSRVRDALWIMDGIRNGQSLAALLGYKFERGMRDTKFELLQFLPELRNLFPMPRPQDNSTGSEESIAARDVVNGLRIVQEQRNGKFESLIARIISDSKLISPVLKIAASLVDTFDACSDLMLSESVHQAVQGNYERTGGAVTSSSEFTHVPSEFEVANTIRSGISITHRLILGFNQDSGNGNGKTPRSRLEPELNNWIKSMLGSLHKLGLSVDYIFIKDGKEKRASYTASLADLNLEPVDIIYLFGQSSSTSEIAARMNRIKRSQFDLENDSAKVEGMEIRLFHSANPGVRPVVELLTLISSMHKLFGEAKPITQRDVLPPNLLHNQDQSEIDSIDENELAERILGISKTTPGSILADSLWGSFKNSFDSLSSTTGLSFEDIRQRLQIASDFGISVAVPEIKPLTLIKQEDEKKLLEVQVEKVLKLMNLRLSEAREKWKSQWLTQLSEEEKKNIPSPLPEILPIPSKGTVELCQDITNILLGSRFPLMPHLKLKDVAKNHLLKAKLPKPKDISEIQDWLFATSTVRENAARLQHLRVLSSSVIKEMPNMQVIQWPANNKNWVAKQIPEKTDMSGDIVSIVIQPTKSFDITKPLIGLSIDEWHELIPNKTETTGISFHYDAPNAEPPQALLLAVSERLTEHNSDWSWDELVRCIDQSLTLAKMRAVGADELRQTPLDTVLPAIVTAETAAPVTISTSFYANISLELARQYFETWKKT
jgi:hypothetical protein